MTVHPTSHLGGMMSGLAATLLRLLNGRIAGVSGIVGRLALGIDRATNLASCSACASLRALDGCGKFAGDHKINEVLSNRSEPRGGIAPILANDTAGNCTD